MCDDAVGVRIGRVLARLPLPARVRLEFRPSLGLELLDTLEPGQRLLLVDATSTGRPPGTCHTLSLTEAAACAVNPFCCHGVGIAEVLQIARRVAPARLPRDVTILGVEAAILDRFGTHLSARVGAALPRAVALVLRHVGAGPGLLGRGLSEARRPSYRRWDPTEAAPGAPPPAITRRARD